MFLPGLPDATGSAREAGGASKANNAPFRQKSPRHSSSGDQCVFRDFSGTTFVADQLMVGKSLLVFHTALSFEPQDSHPAGLSLQNDSPGRELSYLSSPWK
uniref:Uncharacterized protein n=1 Tax=Sphaerodactylus townsendi TaxID=933632 RepID=A0ACB8FL13_9SAUR